MAAETLTEAAILDRLRSACAAAGGQRAWARQHGLSFKWVNNVMRGHQPVSPGISLALGYRRVAAYEALPDRSGSI